MSQKVKSLKKLAFQIWFPVIILIALIGASIEIILYHTYIDDLKTLEHEHHLSILILLGAGMVCFILYEFYTLRKNLFKPLAEFMRHIQEAGAENYSSRVSITTQNEFSPLAIVLNKMTAKLEELAAEKVEKMKQVISDLNNSTKLLIQRDLELTRANDKLRDLDKMKSEFVSLATHQLRTPLSGVRWSLSMLLNGEMGELTPEQKLYVMKTYESNNRMITLINDMLQADRVEGGTLKFKFTPTNLTYLFENVLTELRQVGEKRKVSVNFKSETDIPPLMMDSENMRIVLQNLIDNAIKYSRENSEVTVELKKSDVNIEITVQDQGIGIPLENQANIFKRFFRAPNAVHTETDGSGLGLYIVESIIQRHRGTIRFVSTENVGTTFYVTLPITMNTI